MSDPEPFPLASGTIRVHHRGFGFVQTDRSLYAEDIFIPRHATKGAVDGDEVEVAVNPIISEKGPEGKIVKILKRGRLHAAGTIVSIHRNASYAYLPLIGEDSLMKINPSPDYTPKIGDRIIIRVADWGSPRREPVGEMSQYLGHISEPSTDVPAAVEEYGLEDAFPDDVLACAESFGPSVKAKELKGRVDFRSLESFTIDPDTAKDFDDALSLSQDKKGSFHLIVHIADVSHYVQPNTPLDIKARQRCNSTYFPGTVLPMLPHALSSHLCSLKPDVNRLTISVSMIFSPEGDLSSYKIERSVIKSSKRFTYREAKEVLDGKKKSKHAETLSLMVTLCHLLKKKRAERGCVEFAMPDIALRVDDKGTPLHVEIVEYDITHQLVEEFMLKANEVVATHLSKQGKPLAYRIHEEPHPENMRDFALLARSLGFAIQDPPSTLELQQLFDEARQSPFGGFLATAFIRSMKLATYSTQNIGHYGLGLEYYTHFTSPIRRYIDLLIHRLLFDEVEASEELEKIALHCSERERLSSKAENAVVLLKKLRLLQMMQQKNPNKIFAATITQVKPFGFAFEVPELLYEGFLLLSEMRLRDYLTFDERGKELYNDSGTLHFRTGDPIEVKLQSVDLIISKSFWTFIPPNDLKKSEKKQKQNPRRRRRR